MNRVVNIKVERKVKFGLETWCVTVDGSVLHCFMHKGSAQTKFRQIVSRLYGRV